MNKKNTNHWFLSFGLRTTVHGLSKFSETDRKLIWIFIAYIYLSPVFSILAYEAFLVAYDFPETHSGLLLSFFLPITVHTGFVINNLKVGNTFSILYLILRVPIEVLIGHFIFQWDFLFSFSMIYVLEIFGFMVGFVFGTIFRRANITIGHRIISVVLAVLILMLTFYRFKSAFVFYFDSKFGNLYEFAIAFIAVILSSVPYIQIFIAGKDNQDIHMGSSVLTEQLNTVSVISILFHVFAVPAIVFYLFK